jgi:hypothetical protein
MSVGDIIEFFELSHVAFRSNPTCLICILSLELSRKTALNGISVATGFAVAMTAVLLLAVLLLIGSPYSNALVFAAACDPAV